MSQTRTREGTETTEEDADVPPVTAHECSGDRTVFTEDGNTDGWIATDLTMQTRR